MSKLWFKEPADVRDIREVAHRLPSWDHDRPLLTHCLPERLVHSRITTANIGIGLNQGV